MGRNTHHAHIAITVLSLLLERVIEHACQDTWRNVRDDLKRIQLAQLSSPHGTVWQVTEPTAEAANRPLLTRPLNKDVALQSVYHVLL